MKHRLIIVGILIAALLIPLWPAAGQDGSEDDDPLRRLLRAVPDTPEARETLVTYGDLAAWYMSWGVVRIPNLTMLDLLPRDPRAYWVNIMPSQIVPPRVVGIEYLLKGDQRDFYGFDFFDADRFIYTGNIPDEITVLEHQADPAAIGEALIASGYEAAELDGAILYSMWGDHETIMDQDDPTAVRETVPSAGQLGALNRIMLLDGGPLVVGRATANVAAALDAGQGAIPSLADDPVFTAAAGAVQDPALDDTGALVGMIWWQTVIADDPLAALLGQNIDSEEAEALREQIANAPTLSSYLLLGFATRHTQGATYNVLAVVFPAGTDAQTAADLLADRMQAYILMASGQPLSERWTFDRALAVEAGGLPVALVVMREDDPPPTPDGEQPRVAMLSWYELIIRRDVGFLTIWAGE